MEAQPIVLDEDIEVHSHEGAIWQRETAVFIATLIAAFVLGFTSGIFEWFANLVPLAGAFSSCRGQ